MKFSYRAYDRAGGEVTGTIDGTDEAEAREALSKKGLYITELAGGGSSSTRSEVSRKAGRGRLKHLAMFSRQFYVLVSSGTQVVPALSALERQMKDDRWRRVVGSVRARVEQGASLSEAMEQFGEFFDSVYRSMVAAGESGGQLPDMLSRLADMTQKRLHVQSAVRGALMYPFLLVGVAVSVLALLLVFVVPRFAELFGSLGVVLPPTTAALIVVSDLIRSYWWVALLVIAGAVVGGKLWFATPAGRRVHDKAVLEMPRLGSIFKSFTTARIVRLLGALLEGHVPILEALKLTRNSMQNVFYIELISRAEEVVARGEPISASFARTGLISPSVYETTRSGEQSGQVGTLLLNLADFLDEENEVTLKSLTSIIEPLILIVLGLLVGVVALSMFMPMFDLTAMTGNH